MKTICEENVLGLERLKAFVAQAKISDASLARRNALFAAHLQREQRVARRRISENPDSSEAQDFNFAFKPCYS